MPDPFRQGGNVGAGALPKAANPFTPGPGKVPPEFGGRYEVLSLAKAMVERLAVPVDPVRLCLLRGVRGVGKPALIAYARRQAAEVGVKTLHIEADPRDDDLMVTCQSLVRDAAGMISIAEDLARRLRAISVARGELRFAPPPEERADLRFESLVYDLVLLAERAVPPADVITALRRRHGAEMDVAAGDRPGTDGGGARAAPAGAVRRPGGRGAGPGDEAGVRVGVLAGRVSMSPCLEWSGPLPQAVTKPSR
jgi:hypothetical protein